MQFVRLIRPWACFLVLLLAVISSLAAYVNNSSLGVSVRRIVAADHQVCDLTGAIADKDVRIRSLLEYGDEVGRIAKVVAIVSGPNATVQATYAGRISGSEPLDDFTLKEMRHAQCYLAILCIFGPEIAVTRSDPLRGP